MLYTYVHNMNILELVILDCSIREYQSSVNVTSYFTQSLSTVVLNSRDRHENVWLPKNMRLEKQPF